MASELEAAKAEHAALLATITYQRAHADSAPVEAWALRSVEKLLSVHWPHANVFGMHPVCIWCIDARHDRPERWPCEVYRLIEQESHHGE